MHKPEIFKHARELAVQDMQAITENDSELMQGAIHLPTVRDEIEGMQERTPGSFFIEGRSPRPGLLLLNSALKEMFAQERRPSSGKLRFMSQLLVPLAGINPQVPVYESGWTSKKGDACSMAEWRFIDALQQVKWLRTIGQPIVSTYHDEDGSPILFRKSDYESTAINLKALAMGDDIVLPAGTIVAVSNTMNRNPTGQRKGRSFTLASYALPQTINIAPIRISPWAYDDPIDRATFALAGNGLIGEGYYYDRGESMNFQRYSLEDYAEASRQIIELCTD